MWTLFVDPSRKGYHELVVIDERKQMIHRNKEENFRGLVKSLKHAEVLAQDAGHELLIGIEKGFHTLLPDLMDQGYDNLYEIFPNKVAHYRKSFEASHQKTDEIDAFAGACYLLDWHHLLPYYEPKKDLIETAEWISKQLATLRRLRTETRARFWSLMDYAMPGLKELDFTNDTKWFYQAVDQLFGQGKCKHMGPKAFIDFCRKRTAQVSEEILREMLVLFKRGISKYPAEIISLHVRQLMAYDEEIVIWQKEAGRTLARWDQGLILNAIKGLGPKTLIRLLAYIGEDWTQKKVTNIAAYAGIAPVLTGSGTPNQKTAQSLRHKGKKVPQLKRSHRLACNKDLKTSLCLFACFSMRYHSWAKRAYERYRQRGQTHWEALRNLSIKWVRILHHLVVNQIPYDSEVHEYNIGLNYPQYLAAS